MMSVTKEDSHNIGKRRIVSVFDGVKPGDLAGELASNGLHVPFLYHKLSSFAVDLTDNELNELLSDPRVKSIQNDVVGELDNVPTVQTGAQWHIDRIDQRELPLDAEYHYDFDGSGVIVYIMDGWIRTTHERFGGRASYLDGYDGVGNRTEDTTIFHGTCVAGLACSDWHGAARGSLLKEVRVSDDGFVDLSVFTAGINWIIANHPANTKGVINASLSWAATTIADDVAEAAEAEGFIFVCAAGNQTSLASTRSPARSPSAITVGGSTSSDGILSTSNFGPSVDLFAPGDSTVTIWPTSDTAQAYFTGTSAAAPIVAGVCATIWEQHPTWTNTQVRNELMARCTSVVIDPTPANGSPELLLYSRDPIFAAADIYRYDAQYKRTSDPTWTYAEDIGGEPYVLSGLDASTEYEAQFRVYDTSTSTLGDWSVSFVATTASSSQNINLGIATEVNAASPLAIANPRSYLLGTALETSTASSLTVANPRSYLLGATLETDTAHALTAGLAQIINLGTAQEICSSSPLSVANPRSYPLTPATEADTAHALTVGVDASLLLGRGTELDTAHALTVDNPRSYTLGTAAEVDAAFALMVGIDQSLLLGTATEIDLAGSMIPVTATGNVVRTSAGLLRSPSGIVRPAF